MRQALAAAVSGVVLYGFMGVTFNGALSTFIGQTTGTWTATGERALGTGPGLLMATLLVPLILSSLLQGGAWVGSPVRSSVIGAWPLLAFAAYMLVMSHGSDVAIRNVQVSFFSGVMLAAVLLIASVCGYVGGKFARQWLGERADRPLYGIRWFHYLWLLPTAHYYLLIGLLIYFAAFDTVTYGILGDNAAQSVGGSFVLIGGAIGLFGVQRLVALHSGASGAKIGKTILFGPVLAIIAWYITYAAHLWRITQFVGEHDLSATWTLTAMVLIAGLIVAAAAYLSSGTPGSLAGATEALAPLSPDYSSVRMPRKPRPRRPSTRGTTRRKPGSRGEVA